MNQYIKILLTLVILTLIYPGCKRIDTTAEPALSEQQSTNIDKKADKDIFQAIEDGDINAVKTFLTADQSHVNTERWNGWEPLRMAVYHGNKEIVDLLIASGADLSGSCYLMRSAASSGHYDIADLMRTHCGKVGIPQKEKDIFIVVGEGDIETVRARLKKDPSLANAVRSNGPRILEMAAYGGDMEIIELLIAHGADAKKSPEALNHAASTGNKAMVLLLLSHGADVNLKQENRNTPLHYAALEGHRDICDILLKRGAKITIFEEVLLGRTAEVKKLLEKNPEFLQAADDFAYTALHFAAMSGSVEICKLLLDKGAKVDATSLYQRTPPLFLAVANGHIEVVKLLLKRGADINASGFEGLNVVSNAMNEVTLKFVLENGADVHHRYGYMDNTALFQLGSDIQKCRLLIEYGADVKARNLENDTPLHDAKNPVITQLLIDKGANVNARNEWGFTPLHYAASRSCSDCDQVDTCKVLVDTCKVLIDNGADVNVKDEDGMTPLHRAIIAGVAKLLIAKGADVKARDGKGRTPLHHAVTKSGSWTDPIGVCKTLMEKGADVNAKDKDGLTPLKLAIYYNNTKIVELLKKHGGVE